jgi:hypothetical protein
MTSTDLAVNSGIRPAGGGLLVAECHEILSIPDAWQGALDGAIGIEAHIGEPVTEAPVGLADIDAAPKVLRIGVAGRDDHDLGVGAELTHAVSLLFTTAGPSQPRGAGASLRACARS